MIVVRESCENKFEIHTILCGSRPIIFIVKNQSIKLVVTVSGVSRILI